jgi:hypothetical protein
VQGIPGCGGARDFLAMRLLLRLQHDAVRVIHDLTDEVCWRLAVRC